MPNQSHNLRIVPILPGSLTESKARTNPDSMILLSNGILNTAKQVFGVVSALILFNSFSVISVILLGAISLKSSLVV